MGIIHGGILGGFKKKTGAVIGAYWRSLHTMRGLPRKSNKPPTEAQLLQQTKFKLVVEVLSYISPLINAGYQARAKISTPMNLAVKEHLQNAILVVAGVPTFDYTKLKFSEGPLLTVLDMSFATTVVGQIELDWTHNLNNDIDVDASDKLSVLAYNKDKDRYVRVYGVAPRSAGSYVMTLPGEWSGDKVMCFYSFNSIKKKNLVSDSVYLGTLTMV